ncbi:PDGLE domain-containing protein [Caminibacter sp.]
MKLNKKVIFGVLFFLLALVPLGLLDGADAWGEWDPSYFKETLGFIPAGIEKVADKFSFVKPLLPDYSLPHSNPVLGYYISAIVGVGLIFLIMFILAKLNRAKK